MNRYQKRNGLWLPELRGGGRGAFLPGRGGRGGVTPSVAVVAPTIGTISPATGSEDGGTSFAITGCTGLIIGATAVTIGGVACTSVSVADATSLTAVSPAGTVGDQDVVVTTAGGSDTAVDGFTYTASGFDTPDILDNASFESGFDGFTKWNGVSAPDADLRSTVRAHAGATSLRRVLPASASGSKELQYDFGNRDRVWVRVWLYLTAAFDGTHKAIIFENNSAGSQFGGMYFQSGYLTWPFIGWGGPCGTGHAAEWNSQSARIRSLTGWTGAWHSLEWEYWRNGHPSGYPAMQCWLDGVHQDSYSNIPSPGSVSGGYLIAGERQCSAQLRHLVPMGIQNASPVTSVAADFHLDEISISSLGRIGP